MRGRISCLVAMLALCAGLIGCGGGGDSGSTDAVSDAARERNQRRLDRLERRVERLKRERKAPRAGGSGGSAKGLAGFDAVAGQVDGEAGVAAGGASAGGLTTGSAWSTIKVPIAMRVLQDVGGPGKLTSPQRSQIDRAITQSDNAAADQLFGYLKSRHGGIDGAAGAVTQVLRKAGDGSTNVSTQGRDGFSPYGQTEWSLEKQQKFMAALAGGCVGDAASRRFVLDLMGRVTSDTWGLGSAGAPARWKGGWGPGTDGRYLVRQMGVLDVGGKQVVVALAARPSDGQFASGQAMATRIAKFLAQKGSGLGASGGC